MMVVLISMMMENIKWLRILNSIACGMFVIYGYFHEAYPVVIMNITVIFINLYKLKSGK
jgi:uncharacterized protein with PQ loop repeat